VSVNILIIKIINRVWGHLNYKDVCALQGYWRYRKC